MANNQKKKRKKTMISDMFADKGNGIDLPFLFITIVLLVFGLIMLYSSSYVKGVYAFKGDSYHYIKKQLRSVALGAIIMIFASRLNMKFIKRYAPGLWVVSIILLCAVFFYEPYNGCHRWISIKNIVTFQPSEIAKFAIIANLAAFIEDNSDRLDNYKYILQPIVVYLVPILILLIFEPHLSCIVIICSISVILLFVGGVKFKKFLVLGSVLVLAFAVTIVISQFSSDSYFLDRILNWVNNESVDLTREGYQSYMSLLAIGSGNWFGLGFGNSRQKHLHLPERWNDFIYSIAVEELGFIGSLIIIGLFIALMLRGMHIAKNVGGKFESLIVMGVVCQIVIQAGLNMAVATNTIPNTGVSLPFFSEGGTALMILMGEIGVVLSVSRTCKNEKDIENESDNSGRRDSWTHKSRARNSTKN